MWWNDHMIYSINSVVLIRIWADLPEKLWKSQTKMSIFRYIFRINMNWVIKAVFKALVSECVWYKICPSSGFNVQKSSFFLSFIHLYSWPRTKLAYLFFPFFGLSNLSSKIIDICDIWYAIKICNILINVFIYHVLVAIYPLYKMWSHHHKNSKSPPIANLKFITLLWTVASLFCNSTLELVSAI